MKESEATMELQLKDIWLNIHACIEVGRLALDTQDMRGKPPEAFPTTQSLWSSKLILMTLLMQRPGEMK